MKEKLDLMTLMDFLGGITDVEALPDSCLDESATNYLQNGVRILTLARQKKSRYTKQLESFEHIAMQLNYMSMPENSWGWQPYFIKVMKRYINSQIKSIMKEEFPITKGISFFYGLIGDYKDEVILSYPKEGSHYELCLSNDVFKSEYSLQFEIKDKLRFFGPLIPASKKKSGYYHYKRSPDREALIVDTYDFISILCFMNCIFKVIRILKENSPDSRVIHKAQHEFNKAFDFNWKVGNCLTPQGYLNILLEKGFTLNMDTLTYEKPENSVIKSLDDFLDFNHPLSIYHALYLLLHEKQNIPASILFQMWHGRFYYNTSSPIITFIFNILHEMVEVSSNLRDYDSRRKNKHIATAYMTKKNIPDRILNAMKSSKFNDYFGYVEFDEDVDLSAVHSIEQEFDSLNQRLFHHLSFSDAILRIRKLGKHKAAGLYYPGFNTLCVDIRSPSSFLHEYMHMLDDQWGDLSLSFKFDEIVELYRSTIREHLHELPKAQREILNGKSKYNLKYFFHRVEIFARCGEIYFSRILKIESSLLMHETEYDFAYPVSDELDLLIKNYYENLLHEFIQLT